ncbi:MAG TPA: helix-turn-helix domain-containing protein, partial [Sphingobacterium sp.]|nr:helix-turn-helix domain-containing protein [Sphingobacterium sp.]
SQDELAKKFGANRSTISRMENDLLKPSAGALAALASFGMNIEEILPVGSGFEKEKALQIRVTELELKLMQVESKLSDLIKFVEEKL